MRQIRRNPDWIGSGKKERERTSLCPCGLAGCLCRGTEQVGNGVCV